MAEGERSGGSAPEAPPAGPSVPQPSKILTAKTTPARPEGTSFLKAFGQAFLPNRVVSKPILQAIIAVQAASTPY